MDGSCRSGPLICTAHSVRMILRGQKTQSRRVCKRQKGMEDICDRCWFRAVPNNHEHLVLEDGTANVAGYVFGTTPYLKVPACEHADRARYPLGILGGRIRSPYGTCGDRLWVREACRELDDGTFRYRADVHDGDAKALGPWKTPRFVPKRSARIWLAVLGVRVERLSAITDEDALAEGVEPMMAKSERPAETFARLWDTINKKRDKGAYAWTRDPWVWRIAFRCADA